MKLPAILPLLFLLLSCARPSSFETFIPAPNVSENVYLFDVDFTDSTSLYDVSFYTKIDSPMIHPRQKESFLMDIFWVTPSDRKMQEKVYYPSWEPQVLYRSGLEPSEPGIWRLAVQVPEPPVGFRGLGIIVSRKTE